MGKIEKSLILNSDIRRRKCNEKTEICEKKKKQEAFRRVSIILRKCETLRTNEEIRMLESATDIVKQILARKTRQIQSKERVLEKEDPRDVIEKKAQKLAEVISRARHLVCYTGAGISTSARIPDYRGSQGIWTLLQQGKDIGQHDLSLAEPTYTHMALYELHRRNILRYVLSQNCDGLHLRSGLPKKSLSEVHGNMYVEVCKHCKPNVEYWRLFDTTELTARYYHKTNRRCHLCGKPLIDTIVHFGERGSLKWPLNWDGAISHADKADVILCMGSSLKVLKKYPWLWSMDRPKNKRPKIYIVNLQWTPKDGTATMKINGKCDQVMELIMKYMNITVPKYNRQRDPIFAHASLLAPEEIHTRSQPMLQGHKDVKLENFNENRLSDDDNDDDDEDDDKINGKLIERNVENDDDDIHSSCNRLNNFKLNEINGNRTSIDDTDNPNKSNVENLTNCSTIKIDQMSRDVTINEDKLPEALSPQSNCDTKLLSDDTLPIFPLNSKADVNLNSDNICKLKLSVPINSIKCTSMFRDATNDKDYKHLLDYCKVIGHLPHWYDVNYAYSGLHSIIYPPPTEVDLWGSVIIPIFQLNRSDAECEFCFDNYAEYNCQFYRPKNMEFNVTCYRKGRLILCECCDYTDESDNENADECEVDENRAKLENINIMKDDKESVKIQAGWYGKGFRKMFRRKKRI